MRDRYVDLAAKTSFAWMACVIILMRILFGFDLGWILP